MAIKIYIPIKVEIEDKVFEIEVRDLSESDIEEIKKVEAENVSPELLALFREAADIGEDIEINEGLLASTEGVIERGKLWLEKKRLKQEKKRVNAQAAACSGKVDYSLSYKKRFELTCKGKEKEALAAEMKKYNISYKEIVEEIDALLKEAKKKKQRSL